LVGTLGLIQMALRIEDYALIGDTQTAALVGRDGSIDWLCVPRFDSPACFAALLGNHGHGRWVIAPSGEPRSVTHRYRAGTLILETTFETAGGSVRVVDLMPPRARTPKVIRMVEGVEGRLPMRMELAVRFDYGSAIPWVRRTGDGLVAVAGPNALCLTTPVETRGEDFTTVADFTVRQGDRVPFVLAWSPSHLDVPPPIDPFRTVDETETWWRDWSGSCSYEGEWTEAVKTSLVVLKALTYAPTGGIIAAPTTSLPEQLGGVRNWDYRYSWLRDATFTLYALSIAGYKEEAIAWRDWLIRAVAGSPSQTQIMYGLAGERLLPEVVLEHLPGYEESRPVRIGNAAHNQFQLDVYGEVMDALHLTRAHGIHPEEHAWAVQLELMNFLESNWHKPDDGIWEVRGPRRHFTHSKVMAWVAADRAVKDVERFGMIGPGDRWRRLRDEIHAEVLEKGFDAEKNAFVQYYGSHRLDGSLLMMPLVGFLSVFDARIQGTVEAIQRELLVDGLVLRYVPEDPDGIDALPGAEGAFLPCSFWLVDNLALMNRRREARTLFERLLQLRNDVGLLAEEYDPDMKRLLGNFPQAFTHVGLINSARNLSRQGGPAQHRAQHHDREPSVGAVTPGHEPVPPAG
jgi:GH15 family glucan-1,4-alpha-glucosidase